MFADRVASLDGFHGALRGKLAALEEMPEALGASQTRVTEARAAIDATAITDGAIDVYDDALVEFANEIVRTHLIQRFGVVKALHAELGGKVDKMRRAPKAVKRAAKDADVARRAIDSVDPTSRTLTKYDTALDSLSAALAEVKTPRIRVARPGNKVTPSKCDCDPNDPLCPCLPGE